MKAPRRLLRISISSALVFSAPIIVLSAWCAWTAYANLDAYRRIASPQRDLSIDDFHIAFHDMLSTWSNRFFGSNSIAPSHLPRFRIHLKNPQLHELMTPQPGKGKYVDGVLTRGGKNISIRLRQRGHRHWHRLGTQKSLKVRFGKDGGDRGLKAVALVNEPTPFMITNALIAQIAGDQGLLNPEPDFVRVWINGADMGVYRRQIMADEALLRRSNRYPCSLYSGDMDTEVPAETLWMTPGSWKKSAWCSGEKKSNDELASLLRHISSDSFQDFSDFAHNELDLKKFATLDALEILFSIDQRDWRQGHKLVHDLGSGKWEPIAWSLRGFDPSPVFKPSNHPLGIRLEMVPGYLTLRNRILHRLLLGPARPSRLRTKGLRWFKKVLPELMTDAHWDAYELAPGDDSFLYKMLRPMDVKKLSLVFESLMALYATRCAYLLSELENPTISATPEKSTDPTSWPFEITLGSRVGISVDSIRLQFADKQQHPWLLKVAGSLKRAPDEHGVLLLAEPMKLLPSVELVKNPSAHEKYNPLVTRPAPVSYKMEVRSDYEPVKADIWGKNLATSSKIVLHVDFTARKSGSDTRHYKPIGADVVPSMLAGQSSAHPWSYRKSSPPEEVILGPGDIHMEKSMFFSSSQKVKVQAGTRFLMGKGASLIFLGPVNIEGTPRQPVVVEADGDAIFGGIVIHGFNTAGSRIQYLHLKGGSAPVLFGEKQRGTFSINETRNILLENCAFENNHNGVDMLHVSNTADLKLHQVSVKKSSQDAVDLEFSKASMDGISISGSADEAIDLMGAKVRIHNSVLYMSGGSLISAGERSTVTIEDSILSRAKIGLLVKHDSWAVLYSDLLHECQTGVKVKAASRYYPKGSRLDAQETAIIGCGNGIVGAERNSPKRSAKINLSNIFYSTSDRPFMMHLLRDILGIQRWSELHDSLKNLAKRGVHP